MQDLLCAAMLMVALNMRKRGIKMQKNEQYNKHKKRSHKTRRAGLEGMHYSKSARPLSNTMRRFLSGAYSQGYFR